jgi:hypothetical protein
MYQHKYMCLLINNVTISKHWAKKAQVNYHYTVNIIPGHIFIYSSLKLLQVFKAFSLYLNMWYCSVQRWKQPFLHETFICLTDFEFLGAAIWKMQARWARNIEEHGKPCYWYRNYSLFSQNNICDKDISFLYQCLLIFWII